MTTGMAGRRPCKRKLRQGERATQCDRSERQGTPGPILGAAVPSPTKADRPLSLKEPLEPPVGGWGPRQRRSLNRGVIITASAVTQNHPVHHSDQPDSEMCATVQSFRRCVSCQGFLFSLPRGHQSFQWRRLFNQLPVGLT